MPSHLHEALVLLFRQRPQLAPDLLRAALHEQLPPYREARVESADLNQLQPTEYRADAVVVLRRRTPVLGIVVEVQPGRSAEKRFVWPAYVTSLRARLRCPVCLLVVTAREGVARWAARRVDIGGGNDFAPLVVGPSAVPVIGSVRRAKQEPELAVLSTIAHGRRLESSAAARLALRAIVATKGLDEERAAMYFDLILMSLSTAAQKELQAMEPAEYEYQSAFAKRYFGKGVTKGHAEGKAEGRAEGKLQGAAELLLRQLRRRFGDVAERDLKRVQDASLTDLNRYAERLLTAETLEAVWGSAAGKARQTRTRR